MNALLSDKNPLVKQVRKAVAKGSLTDDGFCVAEGFHLLEEALKTSAEIGAVIVAESVQDAVEDMLHRERDLRIAAVRDADFTGLSSTETPQGVLALVKPPAWTMDDVFRARALVAVLEGIQDPGNAGAILRAAEAFGATGAIFLKGSVSPFNPKCLRGSAGSMFRLPLVASVKAADLLGVVEKKNVALYAAMPRADRFAADADLRESCAIVIGSEGKGVSAALAAKATGVRIPTTNVESLNAAVAAGILFYEARRQRNVQ